MKKIKTSIINDEALKTYTKNIIKQLGSYRIKFNPKPIKSNIVVETKLSEEAEGKDSQMNIDYEVDSLLDLLENKIINKEETTPENKEEIKNIELEIPDETIDIHEEKNEIETTIKLPKDNSYPIFNSYIQKEQYQIQNEVVNICRDYPSINSIEENASIGLVSQLEIIEQDEFGKQIIEEKKGFGYNGLGSRRIVFDNILKEYRYEIDEPQLNKDEEFIKNKMIYLFRTRVDLDVFEMTDSEKKEYLTKTLNNILKENHIKLKEESKEKIFYHIFRDFAGYGRIDILMHDEGIEDISCDGQGIPLFIFHKKYESIHSNIVFDETDELDSFVVKLSQMSGKQISVYEPVVDGKLLDGSRLQTTLGRTITQHSTFTIRKFREDPLTPVDLIANNTMSVHMAAYFWMAIEKNASILFCGGTASGKTTMLNALSLFLPSAYKIVSIEDTREINLPHENWIAGTTRTGFSSSDAAKTGKDIDMFDLVRIALRQRPKAIIVGEIRGREAYVLFQAMTTGHLSYSTIHAGDLHALIQRLENPPISLPRVLLTSLDLVVFLNSVTVKGDPARRVTDVTEIIKLDPDSNRLVTISPFKWVPGSKDRFEHNGGSRIINKIKLEHGWTNEQLNEELNNRMVILEWMRKNNLRSYKDVGKIVTEYNRDPKSVLKKVEEDTI